MQTLRTPRYYRHELYIMVGCGLVAALLVMGMALAAFVVDFP